MACSDALNSAAAAPAFPRKHRSTVQNRPGLTAIAYRAGTYSQFFDTLLARISLSRQPQLRALRTRESDDFTIALLDAFSVMADVLTFYTGALRKRVYLRTATERSRWRSWPRSSDTSRHLAWRPARSSPSPSIRRAVLSGRRSADRMPGASIGQLTPDASQIVTIPVGTRVQSVPSTPNELPQAFETVVGDRSAPHGTRSRPGLLNPADPRRFAEHRHHTHALRRRDEPQARRSDPDPAIEQRRELPSAAQCHQGHRVGRREDHATRSRRRAGRRHRLQPHHRAAARRSAPTGQVADIARRCLAPTP